jgi:hypothetical protein
MRRKVFHIKFYVFFNLSTLFCHPLMIVRTKMSFTNRTHVLCPITVGGRQAVRRSGLTDCHFSWGVLQYFTQKVSVSSPTLSQATRCTFTRCLHKMHLLTAPSLLVIWAVTHPSTNRAQRCLTLVIKWVPVCPTWHDTAFSDCTFWPMTK